MAITYLKRSTDTVAEDLPEVHAIAARIISDIARRGEQAAEHYAREVDGLAVAIDLAGGGRSESRASVPRSIRLRIKRLRDNARRFAEQHQRSVDFEEVELAPGHVVGQRHLPLRSVGVLADPSRFSEIGAAVAAVTCAKAVGVPCVAACMPWNPRSASAAAMHYALQVAGADRILGIGGVQAMASLAFGLFDVPAAQTVVGGDTRYVQAARCILFPDAVERVRAQAGSFVLIATGPTDQVHAVANSLLAGLSDSRNDRVRLLTDSRRLAEAVIDRVEETFRASAEAGTPNAAGSALSVFWRHRAEVLFAQDASALVRAADSFAPQRLHVLSTPHDWWLERLGAYGSLMLGAAPQALFGEAAGRAPWGRNATTSRGFYADGLSGYDFMRLATWQRSTKSVHTDTALNNQQQGTVVPFLPRNRRSSRGSEGTIGAVS